MTEVTIERLGHRGDGIAPGPVFVSRALPGETVSGEVVGDRLTEARILTPSANRVRPPCRHYKACGGCDLQHASDHFVADWKTEVVRTALAAHGIEAALRPILTSPPRSRRRAVLSGRRLKRGVLVGFHGRASDTLTEVLECHLLRPELIAALPMLEDMTRLAASRKTAVGLHITTSEGGIDLAVFGVRDPTPSDFEAAASLAADHDLARLSWNGEVIVERRPPTQRFGKTGVVPPPAAFLQATAEGERTLQDAVAEALGQAKSVVDLFSGCGTFAFPVAERARVHAVEGHAAMTAAVDRGWRHGSGLRRVSTETRDLFRRPLIPDELSLFDAAIIDPPRAGAEAQTRALADSRVRRIAMVSCNPVTFARDARLLIEAGFRLEWVQPVDQFRWSAHVELAACMIRDHMAGNR